MHVYLMYGPECMRLDACVLYVWGPECMRLNACVLMYG